MKLNVLKSWAMAFIAIVAAAFAVLISNSFLCGPVSKLARQITPEMAYAGLIGLSLSTLSAIALVSLGCSLFFGMRAVLLIAASALYWVITTIQFFAILQPGYPKEVILPDLVRTTITTIAGMLLAYVIARLGNRIRRMLLNDVLPKDRSQKNTMCEQELEDAKN